MFIYQKCCKYIINMFKIFFRYAKELVNIKIEHKQIIVANELPNSYRIISCKHCKLFRLHICERVYGLKIKFNIIISIASR